MDFYFLDGDKYVYTDNDWKTIKFSEQKPNGTETNYNDLTKNNKARVRLAKSYNLYYLNILQDFDYINLLLKEEYKKLSKKNGKLYNLNCAELDDDGYGHAYEVLSLSVILNKPYQEIIDKYVVIGAEDGKVDGIFFDEKNKTVNFYQVKLSKMDAEDYADYISNIDKIINSQEVEDARHLYERIRKSEIDFSESLDINTYLISNKKPKGKADVSFITNDFIFDKYISDRLTIRNNNHLSFLLNINKSSFSICKEDYFIFCPAKKLILDIKNLTKDQTNVFDSLFMDNVRRAVKKSKDKFVKILKNEEQRKNFHLYNNGISICGEVISRTTGTVINNPMIINGQQTLRALYDIYSENNELIDDTVFVPLFIKNVPINNTMLRNNIARYNNTQTNITDNDFMSIDENARKIQEKLLKPEYNYYLDIISNGTDSYKELAKELYGDRVILISDFIRVALVIDHPENMYSYKNKQNYSIDVTAPLLAKLEQDIVKCSKICNAILKYKDFVKDKKSITRYLACDLLIEYEIYINNNFKEIIKYVDYIEKNVEKYKACNGDIIKCMKNKDYMNYLDLKKMKMK